MNSMAAEMITRGGVEYFLYTSNPIKDKEAARNILNKLKFHFRSTLLVPSKEGFNIYLTKS